MSLNAIEVMHAGLCMGQSGTASLHEEWQTYIPLPLLTVILLFK